MSKFTTEVRFICETNAGYDTSQGYNSVDEILNVSAPKIFNFDFPIFDENYRLPLEKKILRHYYTREICEETVGLWKLRLEDKLNLIMPYYNKLYESELLKFNPFYDVDKTTTGDSDFKSDSKQDTVGAEVIKDDNVKTLDTETDVHEEIERANNNWNLFSDTPQGGIEGIIGEGQTVGNKFYLTDARNITDTGNEGRDTTTTQTGTITDDGNRNRQYNDNKQGTIKNLNEYSERVIGKQGSASYSKMLQEFRETFLRIDEKLIKELEPLFFGLWM